MEIVCETDAGRILGASTVWEGKALTSAALKTAKT